MAYIKTHAPSLDLGKFHFGPVPHEIEAPHGPKPAAPHLGVLSLLQDKVFKGKGFNNIFRPRSEKPLDDKPVPGQNISNDLELNLTQETLTFTKPIGSIPNRGLSDQPDVVLGGIMYVQSVQDVTNPETGKADGDPTDIHIETGMWVSVPATPESAVDVPTLCRMGSIPHGTTINAQGKQPKLCGKPNAPPIDPIDITPWRINPPEPVRQKSQKLGGKDNRIPGDLEKFNANGVITQNILDDPTVILRNDFKHQRILRTITWTIDTAASPGVDGGGIANIAFLGGPGATILAPGKKANAFGLRMDATFWLETVHYEFSVPPGVDEPQSHQPSGEFGPTFVVPPTTHCSRETKIITTYLQLQYRQTVHLEFNGLSWPHVSVATLAETTTINVPLPLLEDS